MSEQVLTFGPFELHPAQRLLLEAGRPLRLGSRAFDILVVLTERAGEVVGKDELMARVWSRTTVDDANLRVHVAALRRALGDGRPGLRFVTNVSGHGYCFVAPVAVARQALGSVSAALPASSEYIGNLPAPLTRVVGRSDEIRALTTQLPQRRLVTVLGPGGMGKTTIALAVAEVLAPSYGNGVAFVDLTPVADPALVPGALASALGLVVRAEDTTLALSAFLREKQLLVVLDGCEHVVEAAAALVEAMLRAAPSLNVLATSTEPLRAEGEWTHRLQPLGVPPASEALTAAEAIGTPAVQLFVERASAALGGFELGDADAPAVAEICRRLDGMALAIELAAGRADAFRPRELAALLDDRFRVLTRGRRTALPRHRTLRATMDWSHGLLAEPERLVLRRLSVFNGVFGLTAAAEIARGGEIAGPEVSDLVASLVAKSLITADASDAEVYYRLLDTTRVYARERLQEAGETEDCTRRHAEHIQTVFERAEAEWETRPTTEWLAAYARQLDNLRAALDWAFSPGGDAAVGAALTAAAGPLWFQLSLVDEGLRRTDQALAVHKAVLVQDERREMRLHAAHGWLSMYAGARLEISAAAWRTSLGLAEELGDVDYQLRALWALWADLQNRGEFREALALAQRFHALAAGVPDSADRLVGDRMTGASMHFLGDQAGARERIERVLDRYVTPVRRSHAVRFQFDQRVTARITLARILWLQGFADQALREVEDNVAEALSLGHALSLCNGLAQAACPVALLTDDLAAAERFSAMLRRRTAEHALDVWRAYADCFDGELLLRSNNPKAGLQLLLPAVSELRQAGFVMYLTTFLGTLARGLAAAGQTDEALAALEEALARCEQTGERWCLPEILRLQGEVLIRQVTADAVATAEAAFQKALCTAREYGALSWELRAATSLAELWRGQQRHREAHDLLAPVRARFVEGFRTADLRRAAALLEELSRKPDE